MSALLKADDTAALAAVRPFDASAAAPREAPLELAPAAGFTAATDLAQPLADERRGLEAAIAELRERLAAAEDAADAREDAAFERGRREGEDLATGETEKRLELLRKGVDTLSHAHSERLAEYELLALQLAGAALKRVLGDENRHAELVADTVAQTLAAVRRELVLRLAVSPRDFRSEEELRGLAERFPGLEIVQDEALETGGCRIQLRLGTIDLGLPGQWLRLTALFEELARSEPAE